MLYTKKTQDKLHKRFSDDIETALGQSVRTIEAFKAEYAEAAAVLLDGIRQEIKEAVLNAREETLEALRGEAKKLFEDALAEDRKRRYESDEPYVEIVGEQYGADGQGVGLRLDWNSAFIAYLKKNGFTGPTDEAIVDTWVTSLGRETREGNMPSEFK